LHSGHYHGVSRVSHGGGLVLFWKRDLNLSLESSSLNHIDVLINKERGNVWRFTGFYGAPETHNRIESWNLLKDLHKRFNVPWLCAGDFNELLKSNEKQGGRLRPYWQMQQFREALDACRLLDLGFVGQKFTWVKHFANGDVVWERLDRAMSSASWFDRFPATKVQTLVCGSSDHRPLPILPEGFTVKPQRPWRFENLWLENEGCHDTVAGAWGIVPSGPSMVQVMEKFKNC